MGIHRDKTVCESKPDSTLMHLDGKSGPHPSQDPIGSPVK